MHKTNAARIRECIRATRRALGNAPAPQKQSAHTQPLVLACHTNTHNRRRRDRAQGNDGAHNRRNSPRRRARTHDRTTCVRSDAMSTTLIICSCMTYCGGPSSKVHMRRTAADASSTRSGSSEPASQSNRVTLRTNRTKSNRVTPRKIPQTNSNHTTPRLTKSNMAGPNCVKSIESNRVH